MNQDLFKINDNELLYLISEDNEEAFELMFKKYMPLIESRAKNFAPNYSLREDYIQEGRIMLAKAIRDYLPERNKTFNKYFDLILTNRMISLWRKDTKLQNRTIIMEAEDFVYQESVEPDQDELIIPPDLLSSLEKDVYHYKFIDGLSDGEIAEKLQIKRKQVYNATERIKKKLRPLILKERANK